MAEIRDAASRGASLTRQLLTFARKQVSQPRALFLDHLAAGIERMLRRVLGEDVVLFRSSAAGLWPVKVDPGQMEQVLVNMAINARDAMPGGGALSIDTRNRVVDEREAAGLPGLAPGDFVVLSLSDSGSGMSADVVERIFEPFFTTKPMGSGTGLGLAICYGVIKEAGGFIAVESVVGEGTTFRVLLPRVDEEVSGPRAAPPTPVQKGAGSILLVEDEEAVRFLIARALRSYGYDVIAAGSGAEALAAVQSSDNHIDLLVCDVVMPGMNGRDVAAEVRALLPELPVLFITGYTELRDSDAETLDPGKNLLMKPFTPAQLVRRVQRVLAHLG